LRKVSKPGMRKKGKAKRQGFDQPTRKGTYGRGQSLCRSNNRCCWDFIRFMSRVKEKRHCNKKEIGNEKRKNSACRCIRRHSKKEGDEIRRGNEKEEQEGNTKDKNEIYG